MTREKFIDFTKDHIIYLDGATGSNLVKAGMPSGVCPEQWILEHREVMLQLQKEYVQAESLDEEFGFLTEVMTEGEYAKCAEEFPGILHMIRVQE